MEIDKVYIATHRFDLRFTRICVASIRYYYPDISILLLVDQKQGYCSVDELVKYWGVGVYPTSRRCYGWGFIKLEPLWDPAGHRYLILDSDTVLVGKVLGRLQRSDCDFVVQREEQPEEQIRQLYFDKEKLSEINPNPVVPSYTFNTGQLVCTSGILKKEDFDPFLNNEDLPQSNRTDIFKNGEQGLLNYVLSKKEAEGKLTVDRDDFMLWPGDGINDLSLSEISLGERYKNVVHWAGMKNPRISKMVRHDILDFFERGYYSRVGPVYLRHLRFASELATRTGIRIRNRVRRT